MRSDGTQQATYNGHPLYTFVGDKQPGDTNGEGLNAFGGGWFVLDTAGNQVTGPASAMGGATGNSGGSSSAARSGGTSSGSSGSTGSSGY